MLKARKASSVKSARHRSREFALQGLYQWLLAKTEMSEIVKDIELFRGYDKCDPLYFRDLLAGAIDDAESIEGSLAPLLDRPVDKLSPIERAILTIAGCEFLRHPEVPYRVVINEAVELAKAFGGTDGYKYVNGVLDKLAVTLREPEVSDVSKARKARAPG